MMDASRNYVSSPLADETVSTNSHGTPLVLASRRAGAAHAAAIGEPGMTRLLAASGWLHGSAAKHAKTRRT